MDATRRCAILRSGLAALMLAGMLALYPAQGQGRPLTPAEKRYPAYSGKAPYCHDQSVLRRIQRRFAQREREYWHTGREILRFHRARQIGFRSNGRDFIPRRYCTVRARFNDGRKRRVTYSIGEELGMAGRIWSWGVEWCVHGLDYNMAYAPGCRAAGP